MEPDGSQSLHFRRLKRGRFISNVFECKLMKSRILKCIRGVSDNVDYLHIYTNSCMVSSAIC